MTADPDDTRTFTAGETAWLAGVRYATLDYWARSGFFAPGVAPAAGKGSSRLYSFQDVLALRALTRLRLAGLDLIRLRPLARYLTCHPAAGRSEAEAYVVVAGKDVFPACRDTPLSALLSDGQGCCSFVVDVAGVLAELNRRLGEGLPGTSGKAGNSACPVPGTG